eukprot:4997747-Pleurochrysis_carterae.AAC.3
MTPLKLRQRNALRDQNRLICSRSQSYDHGNLELQEDLQSPRILNGGDEQRAKLSIARVRNQENVRPRIRLQTTRPK